MTLGLTQPLTDICTRNISWEGGFVESDNLTTFMCRLSWNLRASTSWNPQCVSRPVMGLLLFFFTRDPNTKMEHLWGKPKAEPFLGYREVPQFCVRYGLTAQRRTYMGLFLGDWNQMLSFDRNSGENYWFFAISSTMHIVCCFQRVRCMQIQSFDFVSPLLRFSTGTTSMASS